MTVENEEKVDMVKPIVVVVVVIVVNFATRAKELKKSVFF